jgi:sRNA-binding carbon storage regulator CsrA
VITRYVSQAIKITTPLGEEIEIGVFRIKGAQVRIGVKCRTDFTIRRIDGGVSHKETDE